MRFVRCCYSKNCIAILLLTAILFSNAGMAQMRQVYGDTANTFSEINKISFYSASSGYIASTDKSVHWIGYTSDSGRTFTKKPITLANVNFNGYPVNLTFGFAVSGVQAFDQLNVLAYGNYGLVPAILRSTDGGNTFTLIFHNQLNLVPNSSVNDMVFPQHTSVGYALDADRVLKTVNQGLTWSVIATFNGFNLRYIEAADDNTLFVMSTDYAASKLLKSLDGGANWQQVTLPAGNTIINGSFITAAKGWLNVVDVSDNTDKLFYTANGGGSWQQKNNPAVTPFYSTRMKFINDSVGLAIDGFTTLKTTDSGKVWERIPRNNAFAYLGFHHNDIQVLNSNQFWCGGGGDFLEINTNPGGPTFPKAAFLTDTSGLYATNKVNLVNYSKKGYSYKWLLNNVQISTQFNTSYTHDIFRTRDTIALIVTNGIGADTSFGYQSFYPPVIIQSFAPSAAAAGSTVTITGNNLSDATAVSFGGVAATQYVVNSATSITATVGAGASGSVLVTAPHGVASLAGFTFIQPPVINAFTPLSAVAGTTVTISGTNFTGASAVSFGGIPATSFTIVSAAAITAVVPSGPSGPVSVTTPGGTVTKDGFIAAPAISSFTPTSGTQGTIVRITGTSLNNVTTVAIGGVATLSFTIESSTSIKAIVGAGASGSVVVAAPGGNASLAGFSWFAPPVISSFSPNAGTVGTTVTITGSGFAATPANNVVYFGATSADVISGNATTLTVKVPVGATFEPITVTSNHLTAYSPKPFIVTFANGGSITSQSFATTTDISTAPGHSPTDIALGDWDGDGKTDLAVTHYSANANENGILLYRNTSSLATTSFADPVNIPGLDYTTTAVGDLDGDGKLDLATAVGNKIATFVNTSTPGNISFVAGALIDSANAPMGIYISDIDGDGKPDIAAAHYPDALVTAFRNTSEPGKVSFAPGTVIAPQLGTALKLSDLDGDNKPDLVLISIVDNNLTVFKNNSTKGNIEFNTPITFSGTAFYRLATGDVDGDGKTDIVASDINGSKAVVLRNTTTLNAISFDAQVELAATSSPTGISLADMDGDGKPDIAISLVNHSVSIFKNVCTPGNIAFAPKVDYVDGSFGSSHFQSIGDINGDGKNDVASISQTQHLITIHKNAAIAAPFIESFTPSIGIAGNPVTITGANFSGVTSVTIGGVPVASFVVNSPNTISVIVGTGAAGEVAVTNALGTAVRAGFVYGAPPVITTFAPLFASVGASITITGKNFSVIAANNIVYFGGVRATVTAATTTSLVVTVPTGSTQIPISVTVDKLTAYSAQLFGIVFSGASGAFSAASFAPHQERDLGGLGSLADMDGDGKLDMVLANGENSMAVARNTSTPDSISFADNATFIINTRPFKTVAGDLDGDGKQDVVTLNFEPGTISVLHNASSAGNISLSFVSSHFTAPSSSFVIDGFITDIDGDGKPDVVAANYTSRTIAVFKNSSTKDSIRLEERVDYAVGGYPTGVTMLDVNQDGKPDMIISVNGARAVVLLNHSIPGTINFAYRIGYDAGDWPSAAAANDLDGDGKADIVISNINSNNVSVLHNTGTGTTLSFAATQSFAAGDGPNHVSVGDLDGDGKADLVTCNRYSGVNVSVLKNSSTPGSVNMQPRVDFGVRQSPLTTSIGDVDGDGLPDVVVYSDGGVTSFLRNVTGKVTPIALCSNTDTVIHSLVAGSSYQWQQDKGAGFFTISDTGIFTGTATMDLKLKNIQPGYNGFKYRCLIDGVKSSSIYQLNLTLSVIPTVSMSTPSTTVCLGEPVSFSATAGNAGSAPQFQWKKNNINTGTNDSTYASNSLSDGDKIMVTLTSNATCAIPSSVSSTVITMKVNPTESSISITGQSRVIRGSAATISAAISNGGSAPLYQWEDSTLLHDWATINGATLPTHTYLPAVTGDKIRCKLVSNAPCISNPLYTSNALEFTVDTIARVPTGNVYFYPNPAHETLTIDSLAPARNWQTISIVNMNGVQAALIQTIGGQTKVTINIANLATGIYFVILRNKEGETLYFKFIKN